MATHGPLYAMNTRHVKGKKFNSELVFKPGSNCELVLKLNVHLKKAPSGITFDADGKIFRTNKWGVHEWTRFVERFRKEGEQFWTDNFWLRTPLACTTLDYFGTGHRLYRPNVFCRLKLFVTTMKGHISVEVASLASPTNAAGSSFRQHSRLYEKDLSAKNYGATSNQKTFLHEIGHALGLPHIGVLTSNPTCFLGALMDPKQHLDTSACYGVTAAEKENIMGLGGRLNEMNAMPWQKRMTKHVPWAASDTWKQWKPSMRQLAPAAV